MPDLSTGPSQDGGTSSDAHRYGYTPGPVPAGKPRGRPLLRLPRRYLTGLVITMAVPAFGLAVLLLLIPAALWDLGPAFAAIGAALAALVVVYMAYAWTTRSYIAVYPDRVVIRGRSFRHEDVLWLDIYEAEEETSYFRVGDDFMVDTDIISEMVFTVAGPSQDEEFTVREVCSGLEAEGLAMQLQRYLPRMRVQRHEGVEDRTTLGAVGTVADRFLGR